MKSLQSNLNRMGWKQQPLSALAAALLTLGITGSILLGGVKTAAAQNTEQANATAQATIPQSHHVVLVMEENHGYSAVVGDTTNWPNLNHLITEGALPTHYYANVHPSIGNYFMLTTGQILTTNDSSTKVWNVANIARRMLASGVSFKIYAEGISRGYVGGNTGLYLIRHNPFAMLSDIAGNRAVAYAHIFPFTQFATDLRNNALPAFSFIVPDVDDDAHNGTPHQADEWLQTRVVDPLSSNSSFEPGATGVLIVDFDEAADSDSTHGGGHVSPVLWGPNVKKDYKQTSSTVYQHQSVLRTVMDLLRVSGPPGAAANAPLMTEFFK